MKKIILHLGTPKTGTTAIQKFLHINQAEMAKCASILYPTAGRVNKQGNTEISHATRLARMIRDGANPRPVLLEIEKEAHDLDRIIISSEAFFGQLNNRLVQRGLKQIKNFYKNDEIKLLIYIRRWDLYLESVYNQATKKGVLAVKGKGEPIHEFIDHCEKAIGWHPADYLKYLSILENIFGNESIEIRSFDSKAFFEGNLFKDLCDAIGINSLEPYEIPKKSNESLNTKQILVISLLIPLKRGAKKPVVQKVRKLFNEDSPTYSPHCFFNHDQRIALINRFKKDEEKLRSYMKNPSGFLFNLESTDNKCDLPPVQFNFEELKLIRDLILEFQD